MNSTDRVMQSYGRCCASPDFFDKFYNNFLASSPSIRERFVNTDMRSQKDLLRSGIMNLVLYARGMSDAKLRHLGQSHSRSALNIHPDLYGLWLESLLQTVKEHDLKVTTEDLVAWREVLEDGISLIKSYY